VCDVVGRIGLTDVTPVVGSTVSPEFPARAVAGEPVPLSAVVFREGHDAVVDQAGLDRVLLVDQHFDLRRPRGQRRERVDLVDQVGGQEFAIVVAAFTLAFVALGTMLARLETPR